MSESEVLISCNNLSKRFCRDLKRSFLYGVGNISKDLLFPKTDATNIHYSEQKLKKGEFWALKDVNFELRRGECLGLIGKNGAGKTTLFKVLNGLIKPDTGHVEIRGRIGALIALGAGFNPILTGKENVFINGSILGLSRSEILGKYDEIVDFAELHDFMDAPVRTYSSGMKVRLGFAIAAQMKPDVMLVDEVLAVGDVAFKRKCLAFVQQLQRNGGSIILVSHNLNQIMSYCSKSILLEKGVLFSAGDTRDVISKALELQLQKPERQKQGTEEILRDNDVLIKNVLIKSDGGGFLMMDQPGEILIEIDSKVTRKVSLSFVVYSEDLSRRVVSKRSDDSEILFDIKPGVETFKVSILNTPLVPSKYCIAVAVRDGKATLASAGTEDSSIFFEVKLPSNEKRYSRVVTSENTLWLDCEWILLKK